MKNWTRAILTVCIVLLAFAWSMSVNDVLPTAPTTVVAQAADVSLSTYSKRLIKGQRFTLKVKGTKKKVTWSSANKKIATVNAKGVVTAKKKGETTIKAKVNGYTYTCYIYVETPKISKTALTIIQGESASLSMKGTYQKVKWSSSSKKIATVSEYGYVTAVKKGTATITAKVGGVKYTCTVTVENPILSKTSLTLIEGNTFALVLNGNTQKVKWSSSNANVATVSQKGVVTAKSNGYTTIYATVGYKSYSCSLTVNKAQPAIAKFTIPQIEIYNNNGIIVKTVESISDNSSTGVKLYIENNSGLSLHLCVHNSAVNGIMYDNNIYAGSVNISSGKKGFMSFYIDYDWFKSVNIQQIEYLDLLLWAYDNDKSMKTFETDILRIPTNHFNNSQIIVDGKEVYNKDGLQVNLIGLKNNEMKLSTINRTNTYIEFDVEDVSINDWAYDTTYDFNIHSLAVFPNCKAYFVIDIDDDFLEESDIAKITRAEFRLDVRIEDDYFNSFYTEPIGFAI